MLQNARVLFTAIGLPVLGWLLLATIWNHFGDQYGPDKPVRDRYYVAESCEERGPMTVRGFGYWWECTGRDERGREFEDSFLTPADIGRKVPVYTSKSTKSSSVYRSAEQPLEGWSFLALPFAAAWIWLIGRAMKWTDRHEPDSPEKAGRRRQVRLGRPLGFDWWRPVTLSREGITWIGHFLRWREIREVRLVGGTLHVRPLVGDWVTIGPFTGERVEVVHQALELFARNRYRDKRDGDDQAPQSTSGAPRRRPPAGTPARC
ncbi:hypothetical protein LFM09_15935 [Lentzea alba]|uniref:DUF6346 domain-containing protein n=1 Tax=Lentzea alba TaxID=2714351 RepID=UPI0039BFC269